MNRLTGARPVATPAPAFDPAPETDATAAAPAPDALAPARARRKRLTPARVGVYAFLVGAALFFLLPLYVMIAASFKPMDEIRSAGIFALPHAFTLEPWRQAWSGVCTGAACEGVRTGFWNSVAIAVPSTVLSILLGAVNGYALSFWRVRYANVLFGVLMAGAFVPVQVMIYPLVRVLALAGIFGSLPAIVVVHLVFGMPVMTLLFRNYYCNVPQELFQAARIDGGGFWRIFFYVMLPMSLPIVVVAAIMQVTGVWNDYILGLTFAGREHLPMTVQLNNVITTTTGTRAYNVDMAATILTALVPLTLYFVSGRWFVRGIAAGAVKG
jgi:glucose/mannose transport system permease protein